MDAPLSVNIARFASYQLCRTRTSGGEIDLVLNLFVGQETVSVTTIARLSVDDAAHVVDSCVAQLEKLGLHPVDDAIAYDRAA